MFYRPIASNYDSQHCNQDNDNDNTDKEDNDPLAIFRPRGIVFLYTYWLYFVFGTCNSITGTDITWKIITNLCVLQIKKFKANSNMSFLF